MVATPYHQTLYLKWDSSSNWIQIIGFFCKRALWKRRYSAVLGVTLPSDSMRDSFIQRASFIVLIANYRFLLQKSPIKETKLCFIGCDFYSLRDSFIQRASFIVLIANYRSLLQKSPIKETIKRGPHSLWDLWHGVSLIQSVSPIDVGTHLLSEPNPFRKPTFLLYIILGVRLGEVGGWGRDPKICTGRDWGMGSSTI